MEEASPHYLWLTKLCFSLVANSMEGRPIIANRSPQDHAGILGKAGKQEYQENQKTQETQENQQNPLSATVLSVTVP